MKKTLFLVRHAHRDKIPGQHDNGLSEKGWRQAADTTNSIRARIEKLDAPKMKILSSPAVRCIETMEPLANATGVKLSLDELLLEAQGSESIAAFMDRIKKFIHRWKKSSTAVTVACSHGDWIPEALRLLVDLDVSIKKGAYYEIEHDDATGNSRVSHKREPGVD